MKACLIIVFMLIVLINSRAAPDSSAAGWSMAERLYGDQKARRIGDLLTVIIEEKSSVSKAASSQSSKSSSLSGSASLGRPRIDARVGAWTNAVMPEWNLQTSRDFSGGGNLSNEDSLTSTMTARVVDVLPNGNLVIEGRRSVHMQEENVQVILTGVIRPRDINSENVIYSSHVADASIRYKTSGPLSREQKRGLFSALWNWLNIF